MYLRLFVSTTLCIIISTINIVNAQNIAGFQQEKGQPEIHIGRWDGIYAGIDNILTVVRGDYTGKISIRMEDGTATLFSGDAFFKVKPKKVGPQDIYVTIGSKTVKFLIMAKRTPNPELMAGRLEPGKYSAATFKMQDGLAATLIDPQLDVNFEIISYAVGVNGGAAGAYREAANNGAKWSGDAARLIGKAGPGTSVFFHHIVVKGTDGIIRDLGTIAFQLM